MTREVFIDLDDGGDWHDEDKPVVRQRNLPYRAIALAAVVALLLGLPTLSLRPHPHIEQLGLFPRPPSSAQGFRLVGDLVVSLRDGTLYASNLDGTSRWTFKPDGYFEDIFVEDDPESGTVIAWVMGPPQPAGGEGSFRLNTFESVALDSATGRPRWRMDGSVSRRGGKLIGLDQERIRVYQGDPPALRWEASGFVRTLLERAEVAKRAWGLASDGTLSEMDLETGAARRLGKLPPWAVANATLEGYMFILRDLLVIEAKTVEVYDLKTLQPLSWESQWLPEYDCGAILCGRESQSRNAMPPSGGLDPRTGRVLWKLPPGEWMWPSDHGILAVRTGMGSSSATIAGLIDPETGERRVAVDNWQMTNWSGELPAIIMRLQEGKTYLGMMTPTGPLVLGSINRLLGACQSSGSVLLCELPDGNIGVWKLTP